MIRMGRSSKPEQQSENANAQPQPINPNTLYPPAMGNQTTATRAVSESESMARDIKEGRLSGFVGYGTVLQGETTFQAMLRVDGHLTGRVTSETGTLIVGSTGRVDANILVSAAVIGGTVNGDIIATERLELGRTAHVVGNIQSPRLVIEDGAILEGNCVMLKARENLAKRQAETQKVSAHGDLSTYENGEANEFAVAADNADEDVFESAARQ